MSQGSETAFPQRTGENLTSIGRKVILTTTIVILDSDLGFVFWLGQALAKTGYRVLPAGNVAGATELLSWSDGVDLLIVNYSVPGARMFAEGVLRRQGYLKIIAVLEDGEEPGFETPGADAFRGRPSSGDEAARLEWLETIGRVLASHRHRHSAS